MNRHSRPMLRAISGAAIGGLLLTTWANGSGPAAASGSHRAGNAGNSTVTLSISADPPALDPSASSSLYDRQVLNSICDKLFDLNSRGRIVSDLATGYKVSKNHLVYTFPLRKGVKFTDGTAFNSAAVKYNLDRDRDPASIRAGELRYVKSVTTAGPYAVKVELTQPFSPFISILTDRSGMMVSPKQARALGTNFRTDPVCTGPFKYSSRVKGDHITLVRNTHYWRKGYPKAAKIVWKVFTDPNTALVNLQSGQVDMTDTLPSKQVSTIAHSRNFKVINKPSFGYQGIYLNVTAAPLNNKYVRQAISELIDRKTLTRVVLGNTGRPGNSAFGPGDLAFGASDKVPTPNLKKAKQLLSKSGLSNVAFTFKTTTDPVAAEFAQLVQNFLAPAGIKMTIQQEDFGTLLDQTTKHNFQAAALGWSGRPDPDQNIYDFFVTNGKNNSSAYSNATVDKYLNQARSVLSKSKRKADYDKVMSILHSDVPYIFLYHPNNLFGMSTKVKGFTYVPDGIIRTVNLSK